ncbi:hypothetical protein [Marseilla massiliensis]|uniref:hypothetical protein n=1 Tax=Marseilla massiliensis TaxID=1841864 RepID=UPI002011BAB5|nr:hypothetical protein [Marseilla massiliensis]MCL1610380.1 hypothetical protein [Marseilla massiliensis]
MKFKTLFSQYGRFEVLYMFVMVIYMAQATKETGRMVGSISGNPIPFLIPIVLTYLLCKRHPISFNNKNLYIVLAIYAIWAFCSLIKYNVFTTEELSYHFFMVYAIVIAYIHVQVFGRKLIPLYENILVLLCKIAVVGWLIAVILPMSSSLFRLFPETVYGNHVIYLFNWMDPVKGQVYSGLLRNAGCSWEPGRFAIMVVLAIFCNLCRNGIKLKNNNNLLWLLLTLLTTQSTTGYFTVIALFLIFAIKKLTLKNAAFLILVFFPIVYGIFKLDFMGEKITTRIEASKDMTRLDQSFEWHSMQSEDGEYLGSLDRFDAMAFEWINFIHDPILGYGINFKHSYFYNNISSNFRLANGLMNILSVYGIFLGLFFFYVLLKSSRGISEDFYESKRMALFMLLCLCAISYKILAIPVFTSFWFYGYFRKGLEAKSAIKNFDKI